MVYRSDLPRGSPGGPADKTHALTRFYGRYFFAKRFVLRVVKKSGRLFFNYICLLKSVDLLAKLSLRLSFNGLLFNVKDRKYYDNFL